MPKLRTFITKEELTKMYQMAAKNRDQRSKGRDRSRGKERSQAVKPAI